MKTLYIFLLFYLFLLTGCVSKLTTEDIMFWPNTLGRPLPQPVVVMVDADFNEEEEALIAKAFKAWETASSNKVSFIPVWNTPKPGWYKDQLPLKPNQGIFMWDLPRDYFHLTPEEKSKADKLWGLCVYGPGYNSAHVIVYDGIDKFKFYAVALHEIGHLLNLKHIKDYSVMHPNAKSDCITLPDAQQLCELYGCTPKPEC